MIPLTPPDDERRPEEGRAGPGASESAVPPPLPLAGPPEVSEDAFRRRTRRSFLVGGGLALAGALGWRWLRAAERAGGLPWPVRDGLEANEALWHGLYRPGALAPTFPLAEARHPKVNGNVGLMTPIDLAAWRLRVEGPDGRAIGDLGLDDVRRLPRVEFATELKCVEGWSVVTHWAGARFADFAAAYAQAVPDRLFRYVGLETPDRRYYVGLHRAEAMHPQTLLCYEMHGAPLTVAHGAPLRLVIPVKYGVKHLKRIGTVRFGAERPRDFWAERGYDWYLGH